MMNTCHQNVVHCENAVTAFTPRKSFLNEYGTVLNGNDIDENGLTKKNPENIFNKI